MKKFLLGYNYQGATILFFILIGSLDLLVFAVQDGIIFVPMAILMFLFAFFAYKR